MKFALYVLGALCFAQLAFAQDSDGYTDIPVPAAGLSDNTRFCIQDFVNKHKARVPGVIDNLKTKCFTGVNVSPTYSAAVDNYNSKLVAFVKAADIYIQSTSQNRLTTAKTAVNSGMEASDAANGLVGTASSNSALRACVENEINADPLHKIGDCY